MSIRPSVVDRVLPAGSRRLCAVLSWLLVGVLVSAQPVEAAAAPTGTIAGVVQDETGTPLPAATVRLVDRTGATAAAAVADNRGRYSVAAPTGAYRVEVEGQQTGSPLRARIAALTVEGDTPLDLVVAGGPAHVSRFEGTVVDVNGAPLPGATIALSTRWAVNTTTDLAGRFRVDVQRGTYPLRIAGPPSASYLFSDDHFDLTGPRDERFVLAAGDGAARVAAVTSTTAEASTGRTAFAQNTVTGTVFGPAGTPLDGVQLALGPFPAYTPATGADGRYSLPRTTGPVTLNLAWTDGNPTDDYCPSIEECQGDDYHLAVAGFHPEQAPEPLDLHLAPATFTIRVVDSAGEPVAGAAVSGTSTAPADRPGGELFSGGPVSGRIDSRHVTGPDGTATMMMIPGHPPVLRVDPPSDRGLPTEATPPDAATTVDVRVPGGIKLRGSISDTTGDRAWFFNAGLSSTDGALRRPFTFAADRQSYALIVPAGRYRFYTDTIDNASGGESDDRRWFAVNSAPFDVTADTTINFTVPALSDATVSFVDPDGAPIEGDLFVRATTRPDTLNVAPGIPGTASAALSVFGPTDSAGFLIPGASVVDASFDNGFRLSLSGIPVRPGGRIVVAQAEGSDLAPPDAPTDLHATQSGPGTIALHWGAPASSHGSTITGYQVTVQEWGTPGNVTATTPATSAVIGRLTPGRRYSLYVSSTTRRGVGDATSTDLTLDDSQPPPPPNPEPSAGPSSAAPDLAPSGGSDGYWALGSDGQVYSFGDAPQLGNAGAGAVDLEPTRTGKGYWTLNQQGRVQPFGDATGLGNVDMGTLAKDEMPASLSATPSGNGYWVFTNRGRAIPFGDAAFLGDVSAVKLNGPVLGSVATPTGKGYYMVAADGGIFTFGDAKFEGSMGGTELNAPVQSLVPDSDGTGYWLVASDGGIFAFDAPFRGSMGGTKLNKPVVGMVRYGDGYLMVGADGGIFNFSNLPFSGSLGDKPPASPVVAVAALPS